MPRARGLEGDWFATVDAPAHPEIHNKRFPRIWDVWLQGQDFRDLGYQRGRRQWPEVLSALQSNEIAILATPDITKDPWRHRSYRSVVRVADVNDGDGSLALKVANTICDLEN